MKFALTVDFEEEVHCANLNASAVSSLSARALDKLSETLELTGPSTIFVVAEIARKYKVVISELLSEGHELGSHSFCHKILSECKTSVVWEEIKSSKSELEDVFGVEVQGFRSPNFAVDRRVIDAVMEAGYRYDASVLSNESMHARATKVELKDSDTIFETAGRFYPPGGGYVRLFPGWINRKNLIENSFGVKTLYVHPWEFDTTKLTSKAVSKIAAFKHSVNTGLMQGKVKEVCSGLESNRISRHIYDAITI